MRITHTKIALLLALVCVAFWYNRAPARAKNIDELINLVKIGDLPSIRLTVDADKQLANAKRRDGVPLIHFAVASGHKNIVTYLLGMGADINACTDYGSALHTAAEKEFDEIVQELLSRGADPNLRDDWKQTPLHRTNLNKRSTVAKLLIDAGGEVSPRDSKGRTPLHRCKCLPVAQLLVSRGADVNAVDDNGYTALHWAGTPREIIDSPTIEFLLAHSADFTRTENSGLTARQLAVKNEQGKLVAILDAHKP